MPLISLNAITKRYQTGAVYVEALRNVSLDVRRGEMLSIIGQSGSGKSTLMNIMGCLDVPTSGRYCLNGRDVSQLSQRELSQVRGTQIGFIFQKFHLIPS